MHTGFLDRRLSFLAVKEADSRQYRVGTAREQPQHAPGVFGVRGLAQDLPAGDDNRVGAERRFPGAPYRPGFASASR